MKRVTAEDQATVTTTRPKRRRDPVGHRQEILAAARAAFAERGYARATLRDIARRAGVTHGLVSRQFRSKEELFLAAVPGTGDLVHVVAGDPAGLPDRIARGFVDRMETTSAADPFVALVRSAASNERAAAELLTAMQDHSAGLYRQALAGTSLVPGDDLDTRVAFVGAYLTGLTFNRYILRTPALASLPSEQFAEQVAHTIRQILFG